MIIAGSIALLLLVLPMPMWTHAAPTAPMFTVNSNSDATDWNPGDGKCETANGNNICTLRAAVVEANTLSGAAINFGLGGTVTYLLTLGALPLNANMSIVGNGAGNTIIDGDGSVTNNRVFTIVSSGTIVNISSVTIRNGRSNQGGGIHNAGNLLLNNVVIINNVADLNSNQSGGGIWNSGALTVTNSFINGNTATIPFAGGGGGIYNTGGTVLLINSTLDSNSTNNTGGAIMVDGGSVSLVSSTVNSNIAANGGGIFNGGLSGSGTLNITGSGIFSGTANSPSSGGGGGIYNYNGTATIFNSTLYLNVADFSGGGLYNDTSGTTNLYNITVAGNYSDWDGNGSGVGGGINRVGGTVNLRNSILGGNYKWSNFCITCSTPDDCKGTISSEDFNLIQTISGCALIGSTANNKTGVDPRLSYPPQFNGGPTLNLALLVGSPAIDAGNTGGCRDSLGALIPIDQRGSRRPFPISGRCDIGAYEFGWWLFLPLILR